MGESSEIFAVFRKYMEQEENLRDEIRNVVKDLDQASRDIITILQNVHKPTGLSQISEICEKAREKYTPVKELFSKLRSIVPEDEFYRTYVLLDIEVNEGTGTSCIMFSKGIQQLSLGVGHLNVLEGPQRFNDHWRFVSQRLVFSAAFILFLEDGKLIDRDTAADFLGISANPEDSFHIELDDFLLGLLLLADELTRLSMNSAAFGDYKRPVQIAEFVSDMNAGFRLLNLKNDNLRKKFDGLKYNLKKVEEVVYDLSIRGLIKTGSDETAAS